ncbi:MAG: LysR family transcriptional regulator [Gammaproteobacteria bacterium]
MDTEVLKTFLEVNRTRHFGKAARNLFITQSAVSARVRQLEETVGMPLFSRARHQIHLTAAGQKMVQHAETILNAWNRARQEIVLADEGGGGLVIAGLPSLCDFLLRDWLRRAYRYFSELSLSVEIYETEELLRRLAEGTVHLALLFEPPRLYELHCEQIATVPMLMVSTRPGISAAEAVARAYVMVDWGDSFRITHAKLFPSLPTPAVRLDLARAAHEFLLEYGGAAYLPQPLVTHDLRRKRLYRIRDAPAMELNAYAVFRRGDAKQGLLQRLLALLSAGEQRALATR